MGFVSYVIRDRFRAAQVHIDRTRVRFRTGVGMDMVSSLGRAYRRRRGR